MEVLIVDDDPANRMVLLDFMREKASTIDTTSNGVEGVQAFSMAHDAREPYTLILMDIMMPVMDGNRKCGAATARRDRKQHVSR